MKTLYALFTVLEVEDLPPISHFLDHKLFPDLNFIRIDAIHLVETGKAY